MNLYKRAAMIFFIATLINKAQAQQNVFVKDYEVPQSSLVPDFELVETYDKGFMAGNIRCLLKTDSLGNKQKMWELYALNIYSIDKTYDGGYIGASAAGIIKLDSAANIVWVKQLDSLKSCIINIIRETSDSGFILGGYSQLSSIDARAILIKTDSVGNVQWSRFYKTTGTRCAFLSLTPDSGFLICGGSMSLFNPPGSDICVIKIDVTGNVQWANHYVSQNGNSPQTSHISATSDGNYVISGGSNNGQFLLKIDSAGNQLWLKEYFIPPIPSVAQWVEETPDGGLIMGGYLITFGGVLMKTDSAGNFQWVNVLGGGTVFGGCVKPTSDGGFMMASRITGMNGNGIRFFKTDSVGQTGGCVDFSTTVTVTDVVDTVISVPVMDSVLSITTSNISIFTTDIGIQYDVCPTGIDVLQNNLSVSLYPNPVRDELRIMSDELRINKVEICDVLGKVILVGNVEAKEKSIKINVGNFAKGIYFVKVFSDKGIGIKKFIKE